MNTSICILLAYCFPLAFQLSCHLTAAWSRPCLNSNGHSYAVLFAALPAACTKPLQCPASPPGLQVVLGAVGPSWCPQCAVAEMAHWLQILLWQKAREHQGRSKAADSLQVGFSGNDWLRSHVGYLWIER